MAGTDVIGNLSKSTYTYTSDTGGQWLVYMRPQYQPYSGLVLSTPTELSTLPRVPHTKLCRHLWIAGVDDSGAAPRLIRRKFPVVQANIANPPALGTIEGVSGWIYHGFDGEKLLPGQH
jgi:hypothetical protein